MLVFLLAFCWFRSVLGGELYSYKFEDPGDNIENVYAPTAMVMLSNIDKAVVFGTVDKHHNWAYVTTLGDDNKAESQFHILKEVRVVNAAVAHPSPAKSGVVLVTGMARSDPDAFDSDLPFVGALEILKAADGSIKYSWLMFDIFGELNKNQQMHTITLFPADDLNLFVAVGNLIGDDGDVGRRGLRLAAFSLDDDFTRLFTWVYKPIGSFEDSGIPKAAERLSTDNLVVAVGVHYIARFQLSTTEVSVVWCRKIGDPLWPDHAIAGVHVLGQGQSGEKTIVVIGNKYIMGNQHVSVKEFDLDGLLLEDSFWAYNETDNDFDTIYSSFLDTDEGMLYLLGQHYEFHLTLALVIGWDVTEKKVAKAAVFRSDIHARPNEIPGSEHFPKSVRAMAKADSGTLMFAMETMFEDKAEAALVTMTDMDCFEDISPYMKQFWEEANTTLLKTHFLTAIKHSANAPIHDIEEADLSRAKVLCTDATTTTTSTKGPRTHGPTTVTPTTTEKKGGSGGSNKNNNGLDIILILVIILLLVAILGMVVWYVLGQKKEKESDALTKVSSLGSKSGSGKYVRTKDEEQHDDIEEEEHEHDI